MNNGGFLFKMFSSLLLLVILGDINSQYMYVVKLEVCLCWLKNKDPGACQVKISGA